MTLQNHVFFQVCPLGSPAFLFHCLGIGQNFFLPVNAPTPPMSVIMVFFNGFLCPDRQQIGFPVGLSVDLRQGSS